jgi:hypothetical protein
MIYDWCRGRMNRDQEVVERKAFVFIVTIYRIQFDTKYEQETSTCFPFVMYVVLLVFFEFYCQNKRPFLRRSVSKVVRD